MRDRDLILIALAFVLAGCPLGGSATTTLSAGRTTTVAPAAEPAVAAAPVTASTTAPSAEGMTATGGKPRITVPNLIGKTPEQARVLVKAAGFNSEPESNHILECMDAARDEGLINCQDPEAGAVVERYSMIKIHVYRGQVITGAIVRRQTESLRGLTPDEAKQQLKKFGHDAKVSIGVVTDSGGGQTYIKACGQNKVCYTSGDSGFGIHDDVTLYINPTLKIAAPPP
ncbi:MAG TPA: PASTA domain-containing protein [Kofleriaceae bacterium]|nr:PASTA domain-containing protein [Kofleriaceae bacterium]